jgi:hypothetical protein
VALQPWLDSVTMRYRSFNVYYGNWPAYHLPSETTATLLFFQKLSAIQQISDDVSVRRHESVAGVQ